MDKHAIGHCRWAIPEGYIPSVSHGLAAEWISHEALCVHVPVVVQHTRLDSRQPEKALMTTIAFHGD